MKLQPDEIVKHLLSPHVTGIKYYELRN